jgi:hypothetical protein
MNDFLRAGSSVMAVFILAIPLLIGIYLSLLHVLISAI